MKLAFIIPTILLLLLANPEPAIADTPPPGTVNAKMQDGSGNPISSTVGALNVNVSNTGGLTTVNQGTAGSQSWLASITASALPANACKETGGNLATIASELSAPLAVTGTFFQATQPVSIAAPISIASFPASQTVNGSVSILNFPATQPVSGTFWQSIQPVSGTVTANAGSGTFTVDASGHTVPVSGTFFQATQPISAASLPLPTGAATSAKQPALGIAGTPSSDVLTVQGATSMTPLKVDGSGVTQPVSGTFWQTTQPVSGTFWQATQPVSLATLPAPASLPLPTGAATSALQSTGNTALSTINTTLGSPFQAGGSIANTSFAATQGTAANLNATVVGPSGVALAKDSSLTTINSTLGSPMQETGGTVTANAGTGTFAVSGTFWQATQPVSLATLPAPASLPLPLGAATSANQTNASQKTQVVDGSGNVIASTSNALNVNVQNSSLAVTGTFFQTTQPVSLATLPAPASLPLPTGAATSANQSTSQTTLSSILTALGSPFQAGGSIANTSFAATQATAANLNATVVGTVSTQAIGGATGSQTTGTVSTVATLTAPSNAQGFILQNLGTSTANLRFAMGATATTTLGMQLAPGQDSGFVPTSANVSLVSESGTQNYNIQWVAK